MGAASSLCAFSCFSQFLLGFNVDRLVCSAKKLLSELQMNEKQDYKRESLKQLANAMIILEAIRNYPTQCDSISRMKSIHDIDSFRFFVYKFTKKVNNYVKICEVKKIHS